MKAAESNLLEFISKSPQFVIPIYQRTYSWTKNECSQLWEDILRAGENDKIKAHFIGAIVYIQNGLYSVTAQSSLLVIDGQQRLTTVILLLTALSDLLDDEQEIIDGFSKKQLKDFYLMDPRKKDNKKYKLILSQTDNDTLIALVDSSKVDFPKDYSIRIKENYEFLKINSMI